MIAGATLNESLPTYGSASYPDRRCLAWLVRVRCSSTSQKYLQSYLSISLSTCYANQNNTLR
jgi:hypothetical protein